MEYKLSMSGKSFILFIDSGIGGLSIAKHLLAKKNEINLIYYADVINFPYGNKEENEIGRILLDIYNCLKKKFDIPLIVIACNTASVSALRFLRENIDIPVIGTVPAVKLAAKMTENGHIGVIATETTVKLEYLSNLIRDFAHDKQVTVQAAPGMADAAENDLDQSGILEILEKELTVFKKNDVDTLVLGCTHYSFLFDHIDRFFNHKIKIVDSREGVANRILYLMPENVLDNNSERHLIVSDPRKVPIYENLNMKLKIFTSINKELCP